MNVNVIAITPPKSEEELRVATPELLASCLAKYSRSDQGIDSILDSINWGDTDGSLDRIFKFIDYGHASIGGMTGGIAITIDDCSMYLAYKIFEMSNLVDGQESSTRYIKMDSESLPNPDDIGIPKELQDEWVEMMTEAFDLYNEKYKELDELAEANPDIVRYPDGASDKVRDRIRKNFALDRARYLIPFATKTSAAYIMTARVWADVIKQLASMPVYECQQAAESIREQVSKISPRLMKHSYPDDASSFNKRRESTLPLVRIQHVGVNSKQADDRAWVKVDDDLSPFGFKFEDSHFDYKLNRYSDVGSTIKRTFARFALNNIAIAELRDLNRHRTGYKFADMTPVGFYLPDELRGDKKIEDFISRWSVFVTSMSSYPDVYNSPTYMYSYLLGTQVTFEHSTQLDKLIYEIELRTGLGAHFRYADHMEQVAKALIQIRPQYEPFINIGTAEPE